MPNNKFSNSDKEIIIKLLNLKDRNSALSLNGEQLLLEVNDENLDVMNRLLRTDFEFNISDCLLDQLSLKSYLYKKDWIYLLDTAINHTTYDKDITKQLINNSLRDVKTIKETDVESRIAMFNILTKINTSIDDVGNVIKFLRSNFHMHEFSYEEIKVYSNYFESLELDIFKKYESDINYFLPDLDNGDYLNSKINYTYNLNVNINMLAKKNNLTTREITEKIFDINNEFLSSFIKYPKSKSKIQFEFLDHNLINGAGEMTFEVVFSNKLDLDSFKEYFEKGLRILISNINQKDIINHDYCLKLINSLYLENNLNNNINKSNISPKKLKL